jgi:hypothetical protein
MSAIYTVADVGCYLYCRCRLLSPMSAIVAGVGCVVADVGLDVRRRGCRILPFLSGIAADVGYLYHR